MASDPTSTPFSNFALVARKPGVSFEDFKNYYENHHIPMFMKLVDGEKHISKYTRHYFQRDGKDTPSSEGYEFDSAGTWDFDVLTHVVYKSKAAFDEMWEKFKEVQHVISEDEKTFLDQKKMKVFFVGDVKGEVYE